MSETTAQDPIELLTGDHTEVEQMFLQIEATPDGEAKDRLISDVVRELSIHAAIEERILYPAMRKALPDGETLVQEAIDEHQQMKEILAAIERADIAADLDPLLVQLIGNVRHHVEAEESELFPKLRASIGSAEFADMGGRLTAAKKMAPTHPHPNAPNTPPGNIVAGAAAAILDKARDALKRD